MQFGNTRKYYEWMFQSIIILTQLMFFSVILIIEPASMPANIT